MKGQEQRMQIVLTQRWIQRALVGLSLLGSAMTMADPCTDMMLSLNQEESWRTALTHANSNNSFAKSNPTREAEMKQWKADAEDEIHGRGKYNHSDVPEMRYFPADGVTTTLTRAPQPYGSGVYPEITVGGLGPKGELPMTMMLPVSGHTGLANAIQWAKTDTYTLYIVDSAKKRQDLVVNAKSLDFVTFQEVIVPLKKGERITLYYHRSGSGGPGGYIEGRALDIVWDGT